MEDYYSHPRCCAPFLGVGEFGRIEKRHGSTEKRTRAKTRGSRNGKHKIEKRY